MVENKYNIPVNENDYIKFLSLLKNNVYKILCLNEEGNSEERDKAIHTVILKFKGVYSFFSNKTNYLEIIVKLEGLLSATNIPAKYFRKTIFEVLNLIDTEIKLFE